MKLLLYSFHCSAPFVIIYHVFVNVYDFSSRRASVTCNPNAVRKTQSHGLFSCQWVNLSLEATPLNHSFALGMFYSEIVDFSQQLIEGVTFLHHCSIGSFTVDKNTAFPRCF